MKFEEQTYIVLCREKIEKRFGFGNGSGYTQRDLDALALHIEEKTGTVLSRSTLKRLWKSHYKQSPQIATLNALVQVLDYKDWQEFKIQNKPSAKRTYRPWIVYTVIFLGLIIMGTIIYNFSGNRVKINGPVHFSTKKTISSGTPNTVIFDYDLSNVKADSFFIQQSWNKFQKTSIDPESNTHTSIYYESGYHRARLLANDSLIGIQPVHILSKGWEPLLYYSYEDNKPVQFKNEDFIINGQLHISRELLVKRNIDLSRYFLTRINNTRDFGVPSDNFRLHSRIKLDRIAEKLCPWMLVIVVTERHIFQVNLQSKGCEHNAFYKMGEIFRSGEQNNLSALGVDVYEWQDLDISIKDKNAEIRLNERLIFTEEFKEDFGDIKGLLYVFDGTGSLDYVKLDDGYGQVVFEDDFMEP